MEFISVEKFLKQPKEVQEVFWEWWNPSIGDLFNVNMIVVPQDIYNGIPHDIYENFLLVVDDRGNNSNFVKFGIDGEVIPLLTEGHLRKFINKYGYEIEIDELNGKFEFACWQQGRKYYVNGGEDLLKVYWGVACEIAKESVEGGL